MKAYLASPMRGYPRYNFDAIDRAAEQLRAWGHKIWSPADHDRDNGFDPDLTLEENRFDFNEAMRWDLSKVIKADAVIVLEGWERSAGCKIELTVARACGKRVWRYAELSDSYGPYGRHLVEVTAGELDAVLDGITHAEATQLAYKQYQEGGALGYKNGYEHGKGDAENARSDGYKAGYENGHQGGIGVGKALAAPNARSEGWDDGFDAGILHAFNTVVDTLNAVGRNDLDLDLEDDDAA